ncbi:MAG: LamG-like jellyroll fold domain-containing protein, partial [Chloroflexota bacterium]
MGGSALGRLAAVFSLAAVLGTGWPAAASAAVAAPIVGLPSGAAARWTLDEGAGASLSNSVTTLADGVLSGGTTWVAGHDGTGSAVAFDGSDGVAAIAGDPVQRQTAMTVTFWAKATDPGNAKVVIAEMGSDCRASWAITTGPSGGFVFEGLLADGRSMLGGSDDTAVWDGSWHFFAATLQFDKSGGQWNTWVDGLIGPGGVVTGDASLDTTIPGLALTMGGPPGGCPAGHSFGGALDDVRIYDRVLTADEIGSAVPPIATTTTLSAAPTFPYCDSHVGLQVTVTPRPHNGGYVDIYSDDGSGPVLVTSSWWTMTEGTIWHGCFPLGDDTLTAKFRGVAPFGNSESEPVDVTVTKRASSTQLLVSPNPVPSDYPAVFTLDTWPGAGTTALYEVTGGSHTLVATEPAGTTHVYLGGFSLGMHEFQAEYSGDAQTEPSTSSVVQLEVVPPEAPSAAITALPWVTTTGAIALSWSGTAGWAPVQTFDVQLRRAPWNGSFSAYTVLLGGTQLKAKTLTGTPGSTYCFRVRSRDTMGHLSAWTAETCTVVPLDDRSLARSGSWTTGAGAAYFRQTWVRSSTT